MNTMATALGVNSSTVRRFSHVFLSAMMQRAVCLLAIVSSITMPCRVNAGDDPVDPRIGKKAGMQAKYSSSGLEPPKASDILFVTDSSTPNKGDLGQYLGDTITIPLQIDRYFGDKDKLLASKAIPQKVTVEFVTYDVDEDASYDPEVDIMLFNGHEIGQLRGSNGNYHRMQFEVDMEYVNLPKAERGVGENTITVQVDVNNGGWLTSIEWISICIPAAPPVVLSHGIRSDSATLNHVQTEIRKLGLPVYAFSYNNQGNDGISDGAAELAAAIQDVRDKCNVDIVNIVAHSMGGLKAREYAELYRDADTHESDVWHIVQIATPNGGSPLADYGASLRMKALALAAEHPFLAALIIARYGAMYSLVSRWGKFDLFADQALLELTTGHMNWYNTYHKLNPDVDYSVVAGDVIGFRASFGYPLDKTMYNYVREHGGANDTVVPVQSAHAVAMKNNWTFSALSDLASHSGLVEDGASTVIQLARHELLERKDLDFRTKQCFPTRGASQRGSVKALGKAEVAQGMTGSFRSDIANDGEVTSIPFYVSDSTESASFSLSLINSVSFSWKLTDPNGVEYTKSAPNINVEGDDQHVEFSMTNTVCGTWVLSFTPNGLEDEGAGHCVYTFIGHGGNPGFLCNATLRNDCVKSGEPLILQVSPTFAGEPLRGSVSVAVVTPIEAVERVLAADDGVAPDEIEGDGIYTASIPTCSVGKYWVQADFSSADPEGLFCSCLLSGVAYLSSANLTDVVGAGGNDLDDNGLYDYLNVNFSVNVVTPGTYRVLATLSDVEGNEIAEGWTSNIVCSAGTRIFPVEFDGQDIYNNGECGGYVISSAKLLEIGGDYEAVVDERENLFTTTDYSYEQFEHSLIGISSGGYDTAVDSDGDGVFDRLDVAIPLYADDIIAGDYNFSASIFDSEGNTLSVAAGTVSLMAGEGGATAVMSFTGQDIAQTDLDGPFYVKSFIIWNYDASYSLPGEYATQPYSIKQWGGTPRHVPRYDFVDKNVSVKEGESIVITVAGGDEEGPCSAQLYLTYNTAAAADLDLAKGAVDGVTPKGGLKFPLTITWAAGETGAKAIEIPVKADAALEGEEFFTLQLANPAGMKLGDYRTCTVSIKDQNTKATLSDGINNQTLKPSTSGAGKWYAAESWVSDQDETNCAAFVQSPDLVAGKTSTISFGSVKGAGVLYFDMKFVGDTDNGASFVDVYDGTKKLGTLTVADNGEGWKGWQVSLGSSGSHNVSVVMTQGTSLSSHVRISNVAWIPSSASSYSEINITTSPQGAGLVSGAGVYANGTKINFVATPRPGYTFVGWYRTSGDLFGSKAKMSVNMTGSADFIARFSKDPYVRGLADPASAGKVTGSGFCASGKKVTLKAAANKGYVLEGWYDERDRRLTQAASLVVDNSTKPVKPSATVHVISNCVSDATYYARFVTLEEDRASISCSVGGITFAAGSPQSVDAELPCGVWVDWPVASSGLSQTTVKVAGLPAGLKYNAKTGAIEGAPSAPSKKNAKTGEVVPSAVKVTVTTAGKSTKVFVVNLTIAEMPAAAVGTFNGFVSPYDSAEGMFYRARSVASFTLTTTAAGKITAKVVSPKGSVSFTASCWDELDDGSYSVFLTARTGEMLMLYVDGYPKYWNGSNQASGFIMGGLLGSELLYVEAQRSSFLKSGKDFEHPEAINLAKAMQGTYKFDATYLGDGAYGLVSSSGSKAPLTLTVKNTGVATVAGTIPGTAYKFSGTGTIRVYPDSGEVQVFVGGASGKSVNIMFILTMTLDPETGEVACDGEVYVNTVK